MTVASGALIAESLPIGTTLDVPLAVQKIFRADCGDSSVGQPLTWTFIEFQVDVDDATELAEKLSATLDPVLGWYCDFRSPNETFVVFSGRIFRYPREDATGRAEAAGYARSVGVPESQIDWPE